MRPADAETARRIDAEAAAHWGLDPFALVEAAGRACAEALLRAYPEAFLGGKPRVAAAVGSGNNGADALVLLRTLVFMGRIEPREALVVAAKPEAAGRSPRTEALKAVAALGVPCRIWDGPEGPTEAALGAADILLDGIAGTGLSGALAGPQGELAAALSRVRLRRAAILLVSIDVPSGLHDRWEKSMPLLRADATLAVEPRKASLYGNAGRLAAGRIIPVEGIFPAALLEAGGGPELVTFAEAAPRIAAVRPDDYKHRRGVVEIRAGSPGAAGAARLAALGAQAAGGGLVRLITDPSVAAALAPSFGGVMVDSLDRDAEPGRFSPDALLLGPGWGRGADRDRMVREAHEREGQGLALVLDADALPPAAALRFSGRTIMTPHPGEFALLAAALDLPGAPKNGGRAADLEDPVPLLMEASRRTGATILLKGHILRVASPDGRLGIVDGMEPVLAMGGTGDVLAGMTAAIAARAARNDPAWDSYRVALCAAALLVEAGRAAAASSGFCDPADVAREAGRQAAAAWLPKGY